MKELFTTVNLKPNAYRLLQKKDGTLVLQGRFHWERGDEYGYAWEDIPTEVEK